MRIEFYEKNTEEYQAFNADLDLKYDYKDEDWFDSSEISDIKKALKGMFKSSIITCYNESGYRTGMFTLFVKFKDPADEAYFLLLSANGLDITSTKV
jgi:hypothetical protein